MPDHPVHLARFSSEIAVVERLRPHFHYLECLDQSERALMGEVLEEHVSEALKGAYTKKSIVATTRVP